MWWWVLLACRRLWLLIAGVCCRGLNWSCGGVWCCFGGRYKFRWLWVVVGGCKQRVFGCDLFCGLGFGCDFEIFYNKICLDAEKIAEKM